MEDFKGIFKKSGLVFKEEPEEPVALKGETTRTKDAFTHFVVAVGKELPEGTAANRAFHVFTPVYEACEAHDAIT